MKRSIAISLMFGVMACGSGSESTPPVSAGEPQGNRPLVEDEPGTWTERTTSAEAPAEPATQGSIHPSVTSCLGLVRESRWAEAISPCTEALRNSPTNREVADALAKAKEEAASQATASAAAAAQEAMGGAPDAASSSLLEKSGESIPTRLP